MEKRIVMRTAGLTGLIVMSLFAVYGIARAGGYTLWRGYYFSQSYVATLDISSSDSRMASGMYCTYNQGNNPMYGDASKNKSAGDWDVGALKAQCGWDYTSSGGPFWLDMVAGISSYDYDYSSWPPLPRRTHGVLCGNGAGSQNGGYWIDYSRYTATSAGWSHDAKSTPLNYDWAKGYWKRDCGPSQVMVGISTKPNQTPGFLCRPFALGGGVLNPTQSSPVCQVVTVNTRDNRPGNESRLDWDYNYVKTECPRTNNGAPYYVNGIAVVPYTSKIQSILCCQY